MQVWHWTFVSLDYASKAVTTYIYKSGDQSETLTSNSLDTEDTATSTTWIFDNQLQVFLGGDPYNPTTDSITIGRFIIYPNVVKTDSQNFGSFMTADESSYPVLLYS